MRHPGRKRGVSRRDGRPEPAPGAVMGRGRMVPRPRSSIPTSRPSLLPHRRPEKRSRHRPPSTAGRCQPRIPSGGGHTSPPVSRAQPSARGSLQTPDSLPYSSVPRPQNAPGSGRTLYPRQCPCVRDNPQPPHSRAAPAPPARAREPAPALPGDSRVPVSGGLDTTH